MYLYVIINYHTVYSDFLVVSAIDPHPVRVSVIKEVGYEVMINFCDTHCAVIGSIMQAVGVLSANCMWDHDETSPKVPGLAFMFLHVCIALTDLSDRFMCF